MRNERRVGIPTRLFLMDNDVIGLEASSREPGTAGAGHKNDWCDAGLGQAQISLDLGVSAT